MTKPDFVTGIFIGLTIGIELSLGVYSIFTNNSVTAFLAALFVGLAVSVAVFIGKETKQE